MSDCSFRVMLRILGLSGFALLAVRAASAQHSIHPPDLLPTLRHSPRLATPEQAKLDAFTGSLAYEYPLEVPPGTGDATPALVLSYSSLTQATEYGWGWSLSLGRIERSTRLGPPSYGPGDAFELDGELLVRDPRVNRFHRERTRFERIEFVPDARGGWWKVTRPDGMRLHYGSRAGASSRLENPNEATADGNSATTDVFQWLLDEVFDPRGNSWRVDYEPVLGPEDQPVHLYPRAIDYSFHQGGALAPRQATRRVEFGWHELRAHPGEDPDLPTSYRGGFRDQISRRLASIRTRVDGSLVARWEMAYHPKTSAAHPENPVFSQLASIRRFGSDGEAFPAPTSFRYTPQQLTGTDLGPVGLPPASADRLQESSLRDSSSVSIAGPNSRHARFGSYDLDGDGLLDRLGDESGSNPRRWAVMFGRYPDASNPARFEPKVPWKWYGESGQVDGTVPADVSGLLGELECTSGDCDSVYGLDWSEVQILDLDGDGRADLVDLLHEPLPGNPGVENRDGPIVAWKVRRSRGDGFGPPELWSPPSHALAESAHPMFGRTLGASSGGRYGAFSVYSLSRLVDLNGDGRPDDLLAVDRDTWSIALNAGCDPDGSCGFSPAIQIHDEHALSPGIVDGQPQTGLSMRSPTGFTYMEQADLQGDGLPDLVQGGGGCIVVFPSLLQLDRFDGGLSAAALTCGLPPVALHGHHSAMRDLNGDGWLDLLDYGQRSTHEGLANAYLGLGDGSFATQPIAVLTRTCEENCGGVDLDSDGLDEDVVASGGIENPSQPLATQWTIRDRGARPGLLREIGHELGAVTSIEWVNSARYARSAARAASSEYEPEDHRGTSIDRARRHYWVVSRIEVSDGRAAGATPRQVRAIRHAEPRYDWQRRENMGLRMSEVTEDPDGAAVVTRSFFHQRSELRGLLQLQETLTRSPAGCAQDCPEVVQRGLATHWRVYVPVTEDAAGIPIPGSHFAAPHETRSWIRDPQTGARQVKTLQREFGWPERETGPFYTRFGNLVHEADAGPDGDPATLHDNGLRSELDYFPATENGSWLIDRPAELRQRAGDGSGVLLGRVRWVYDGAAGPEPWKTPPSRGLVTEIRTWADAERELIERYAYDADPGSLAPVGNLTHFWDANAVAAGAGASLAIDYDADYRSFAASSSNALGHRSQYRVSPASGNLIRQLDPNGQLVCADEDGFGRLTARRSHSQPQSSPGPDCDQTLVQFFHHGFAPGSVEVDAQRIREVRWATPQAGIPAEARCGPGEPECVERVRYVDGLAREYFSAVEAEKAALPGSAGRYFRSRTEWGARGEAVCEWFPERGDAAPPAYEPGCAASLAPDRRVYAYDALLRPVAQKHKGELERSAAYSVEDHDGVPGFERVEKLRLHVGPSERSQDLYRETARDRDGAVVSLCEEPGASGRCPPDRSTHTLVTLDPKKRVTRVDGPDIALDGNPGSNPNVVSISYDAADRRTRLVRALSLQGSALDPTWSWTHDANGNVVRALDPRGPAGEVRYAYDALDRLRFKDFPPHAQPPYRAGDARQPGDVELGYDEPGDLAGGYGRNLGRLTSERTDALERRHDSSLEGRRQLSTSSFRVADRSYAFSIASELDALGRPRERLFPDGERLRFAYSGGSNGSIALLRHGESLPTELFREVRMHPSGAIEAFVHAGPEIAVSRTYDLEQAQRLTSIRTGLRDRVETQLFVRDRAGNPTEIRSGPASVEQLEQQFWYDGMHRLVKSFDARNPASAALTLEYAYGPAGNLTRKGDAALGYGGAGALPDALTSVRAGAYGSGGGVTLEDPCPSYSGEDVANDPNRDGIPTECQCGDITGDGRIDVSDIVSEGRCIFQPGHPVYCNAPKCDANGDGLCDVRDLVAINESIFSGRHHELRCALRPEGQPVWQAEHHYSRAADGSLSSRDLGSAGRTAFGWDAEGRLLSQSGAHSASYAYDARGERILERVAGAIRLFVSPEYEVDLTAASHEKHVFLAGRRALSIAQAGIGTAPATAGGPGGEQRIHHFSDPLGTLQWASDASGAMLQRALLDPYGELLALSDAAGAAQTLPVTPYLFTGHRFDAGSGLHYLGARDYDPRIGAFLSVDPAWLAGESLAQLSEGGVHLNAFAYVGGRPTQRVDPDGRLELEYTVWSGQASYAASSSRRFASDPLPRSGCNWIGSCSSLRADPRQHVIVNFDSDYHGGMIYEMARRSSPRIPPEMAQGIRDGSLWMDDCEANFAHCPFNFPDGTREHFVDRGTALRKLNDTMNSVEAGEDPYAYGFRVGAALHPYSDSTPHGPYRWYLLGHVPRDALAMGWNATVGRVPGAYRFKLTDEFDPGNPAHVQQQRDDQRAIDRSARRYCARNACP